MRQHGLIALLFVFLVCLYLLTASGHIESVDGNVMYGVTQNIVLHGDLHTKSTYGLFLSVGAIPFFLAGRVAAHILHIAGDFPVKAVVSLTNALVTALTAGLLAAIAGRLGIRNRSAIALALVYATCTIAWPYAKTFFSEPLTALCLLGAFWALLHVPGADRPNGGESTGAPPDRAAFLWASGAAVALGLAMLTRETTVIVLPIFALYLAARVRYRHDRAPILLVAGLALAVCLAGVALWNVARFGGPLSTGYTGHLWTLSELAGLYGLLISPYKGLFLYVPLCILAVVAWPSFYRRRPAEALLCGGVFLIYVAVHAAYIDWPGGGNWGPRFLLPALPFLCLSLPFVWSCSRPWTAATIVLCLASLLIQLPAVYVSYARYYPLVGSRDDAALTALANRDPLRSPIVEQWRSVPTVTAHLRHGMPGATSVLSARAAGQDVATMPLSQVLQQSPTVNFPDFWFVYLAISGHLSRLVELALALLALAVVISGALLWRAMSTAPA